MHRQTEKSRRSWHVRLAAGAPLLGLIALTVCLTGCEDSGSPYPADQTRLFEVPYGEPPVPGETCPCLLSLPDDDRPQHAWPLLVALHGFAGDAESFHAFWREAASRNGCLLLTPQGEELADGGPGWSWGPCAENVIQRAIDGARNRVHVDVDRIYLLGFSQGGGVTYRLAFAYPYTFRGIAPLAAYFAPEWLPTGEAARMLSHLRVYIGHGTLDRYLDRARLAADTLGVLGCEVHLEEYDGLGHQLPDPIEPELRRILDFLGS
jgi:predicted esterase